MATQKICYKQQPVVRQEDGDNRLRFTFSRGEIDRDGDVIEPSGWETANFERDPVFLWAHDSKTPPIGRVDEVIKDGDQLSGVVSFVDSDLHPLARLVEQLFRQRFLNAVSVGFLPIEVEAHEEGPGRHFIRQELLEVSAVAVPSLPSALIEAREAGLDIGPAIDWAREVMRKADAGGIWLPEEFVRQWSGRPLVIRPSDKGSTIALKWDVGAAACGAPSKSESKGVVPPNVSTRQADDDAPWTRPALSDFTDQPISELSAAERRKIAGHFAWAEVLPPETFAQLKLPHHRPSDGWIVLRGVRAAMGALLGARGGVDIPDSDRRPVFDHLAKHLSAFGVEPPEFRDYQEGELDAWLDIAERTEVQSEREAQVDCDELLEAFERNKMIERRKSDNFFVIEDGVAIDLGNDRPADATPTDDDKDQSFALVIEDRQRGTNVARRLGRIPRQQALDLAMTVVERRKDPSVRVIVGRSVGFIIRDGNQFVLWRDIAAFTWRLEIEQSSEAESFEIDPKQLNEAIMRGFRNARRM